MEKFTYIISQAKRFHYRDALEFKSQRTTFALSKPLDLRGEKAEDRNL